MPVGTLRVKFRYFVFSPGVFSLFSVAFFVFSPGVLSYFRRPYFFFVFSPGIMARRKDEIAPREMTI